MLVRKRKDWEIPESAATPESDYRRDRRSFFKGLAAAGLTLASRDLAAATFGFPSKENPAYPASALKPTLEEYVTSYNNFYEFGLGKSDPKQYANRGFKPEPWTVEISGLVRAPAKFDVNDLIKKIGGIEQRVYRHRCVEAWSMVVPWDGFPLAKLVALADPKPEARFVTFTTFLDKKVAIGQSEGVLPFPYFEGLRVDEATNELAFLATGVYGKPLPNQNGAPIRLITPWKYGFKGCKSIVKIDFVATQPKNTWQVMAANEYGFYANVNPKVDHPRWSQASEKIIGGSLFARQPTLLFNGYEKQVAALYAGLDLKKNY